MSKFYSNMEYRMSRKQFNSLLEGRTAEEAKMNPYTYVMGVINDTFGLKGNIVRVSFI